MNGIERGSNGGGMTGRMNVDDPRAAALAEHEAEFVLLEALAEKGAEIARLRRIEEAARALMDEEYGWNGDRPYWNWTSPAYHEVRALRAALAEKGA